MKQTLSIIIAMLFSASINAQSKIPTLSKFDVVVSFGSMCCGTATDDFLKTHFKKFSKLNKVTIPVYKASGCGREGEYKVMFSLKKLKPSVKKKFLGELKAMVARQEKKNKAKDPSSGPISLEYNLDSGEVSYCHGGISKW